jgi:transposase
MAHPPEIRAKLRACYVYERMGLEAAADKLEIGIATARRWKRDAESEGDDWERARSAARLAGDGTATIMQLILDDYVTMHQATIEAVKADAEVKPLQRAEVMSRLADAFTKTMAAVSKASPQLNRLGIATDVLQRLSRFAAEVHPHLAPALLEVLEPFAAELARDYA